VDGGVIEQETSIATTDTGANAAVRLAVGTSIEIGDFNAALDTATHGRTFGVFMKWQRADLNPGTSAQTNWIVYNNTDADDEMTLRQGQNDDYPTEAYNDPTHLFLPTGFGSFKNVDVGFDVTTTGRLYIASSRFVSGSLWRHSVWCNGVEVTEFDTTVDIKFAKAHEFKVIFDNNGTGIATQTQQYAFYLHDYGMNQAEAQYMTDNYTL
jgi:hypothetical protein